MFKRNKNRLEPEVKDVPSEKQTLERIESVTERLEWLAKEIEYQLQRAKEEGNAQCQKRGT